MVTIACLRSSGQGGARGIGGRSSEGRACWWNGGVTEALGELWVVGTEEHGPLAMELGICRLGFRSRHESYADLQYIAPLWFHHRAIVKSDLSTV